MSMPFDPKNAPPRHEIGSRPSGMAGSTSDPQHARAAADAAAGAPSVPAPSSKALTLSFIAAAVVALLGGLLWAVVSIASGYNIGFLAWLIGVATGFTVLLVARGPVGTFERVLVGVFAGVAIIVGKYLIFADAVRSDAGKHGVSIGYLDSNTISVFVHHFGVDVGFRVIDWLWVALAVVAAYRISGSRPNASPSGG